MHYSLPDSPWGGGSVKRKIPFLIGCLVGLAVFWLLREMARQQAAEEVTQGD